MIADSVTVVPEISISVKIFSNSLAKILKEKTNIEKYILKNTITDLASNFVYLINDHLPNLHSQPLRM